MSAYGISLSERLALAWRRSLPASPARLLGALHAGICSPARA